jgi:hypothetical protein
MNYERIDLTIDTYIKENFEKVIMILLLIVCTFCFYLIQLSKIKCIRNEL